MTYWLKPTKMKAIIFVCQLFLFIRTDAQSTPPECASSDTNRSPENTDINVTCGTKFMYLEIFLCPIYNANYNESLMILNSQTNSACQGTANWTAVPPVLQFNLSIDEQSLQACANVFRTINVAGTGQFDSFSNIQYVNVSGIVVSDDPASGMITYRPSITYIYSCLYPLQYVINNTELGVAGVSLAVNDNNGSFISTISMNLYADSAYNTILIIPPTGLNLKQTIYVEVTATGLSDRFNVLLDRCFATVDKYKYNAVGYDLFVGCDIDNQTKVEENGISQKARFFFEAFRFVEHKNLTVSRFYVHCITRLCNVSMCSSMLPDCSTPAPNRRRRRDAPEDPFATVTSPAILVNKQTASSAKQESVESTDDQYSQPVVAVIVCVAILSFLLLMMGIYFTWNLRHKIRL